VPMGVGLFCCSRRAARKEINCSTGALEMTEELFFVPTVLSAWKLLLLLFFVDHSEKKKGGRKAPQHKGIVHLKYICELVKAR